MVLRFAVDAEAEQHHLARGSAVPGVELLHELECVGLVEGGFAEVLQSEVEAGEV